MNKKQYMTPDTKVMNISTAYTILAGSIGTNGDNLEINGYGSSSSGSADSRRGGSFWDDDEE